MLQCNRGKFMVRNIQKRTSAKKRTKSGVFFCRHNAAVLQFLTLTSIQFQYLFMRTEEQSERQKPSGRKSQNIYSLKVKKKKKLLPFSSSNSSDRVCQLSCNLFLQYQKSTRNFALKKCNTMPKWVVPSCHEI